MSQKSELAMGFFLTSARLRNHSVVAVSEASAWIGVAPKLQRVKQQVEEVKALATLRSKNLKETECTPKVQHPQCLLNWPIVTVSDL